MTISVAILVPEGIAFATDSRQTFTNTRGDIRVSSDNAHKLFHLSQNAMAMTYGWAFLMGRNIHSHVNDFKVTLGNEQLPIEDMVKRLAAHLHKQYEQHIAEKYDNPVAENDYALALLVGGFDPGAKSGKLYEIYIPKGEYHLRLTTDERPGSAWRGQSGAIGRLVKGYDPGLDQLKGFSSELKKVLDDEAPLTYKISYWTMTLQDAIDLALFLTHTVIQMLRFTDGTYQFPGEAARCGGSIEVAVIEPDSGFKWVQHKQLHATQYTIGSPISET